MAVVHRFREFELDPGDARLCRGGEPVALQPKVFDALLLFVEASGRLVTREELLERLWPGTFVTEESLTQVVRKLRQALGDDPQSPRFLETVPRRGYRFLPAVETGPREGAGPSPVASTARVAPVSADPAAISTSPPARPARGRRLGLALVAILLFVSTWLAIRRSPATGSGGDGRRQVSGEAARDRARWTATQERETFPALAPDARRFAFVMRPAGEEQLDLYVAAAGGGPTRLTATAATEFAPQFSVDGTELLFSRRDGGRASVWRVPVTGGAARSVVADGEWGSWIPAAGGRPAGVVFVRHEPGGRAGVWSAPLDANGAAIADEAVRLWSAADVVESIAVAPDGATWAAVVGSRRVVVGSTRAVGEPRRIGPLSSYVRSVAWEPDGRAVVADGLGASSGTLVRLSLDGGVPVELTPGGSGNFHPTVARDGSILHAREHKVREHVRLDADLRLAERLPVTTAVECFDVSPDGGRLAVTDWDPPPGAGTLALVNPATGERRELGDGLCPAFSPDGRRLAFLGHSEVASGLWLLDLADGSRRRLAADRGSPGLVEENAARRPAWSADGARLAYEGEGLPEGSGLFTVEVVTGAVRLLAPSVFGQPAWSPDGRWLAVSGAGPESGFVLIEVATGEARRVLGSGAYRATPVWLDSDTVAFLVDQASRPALVAVDAASGRAAGERRALDVAGEPAFWGVFELRPDRRGGWIAGIERYESDLYLLSASR